VQLDSVRATTTFFVNRTPITVPGYVGYKKLIVGTYQINLFEDTQEAIRLYQAIDSIKKQFGEKFVVRAACA
jgi:hypothetical protein